MPGINTGHDYLKYSKGVSTVLLFSIPAICFYAFQKGIFYFQENNSLFIYSGEFLEKFVCRPGGLLQYTGLFLAQGYFSPLYGSLAVSVIFTLLGKVFSGIIRQLPGKPSFFTVLMIVPPCLLMLLQRRYDHLMEYNLGFLVAGAGFLCLLKLNKWHKSIIPLLISLFFYLAGSFALIIMGMYVIYAVAYEKGRSRLMVPGFVITSGLITFLIFREFLFLQPAKLIILNPIQNYSPGLPLLFVLLSGYFIFFPFIIKSVHVSPGRFPAGLSTAIMVLVFSATAFTLTASNDPVTAENAVLEKMVNEQDWNGVISHHEKAPSANITGQYYYNVALSETDQLCDRLFMGRQDFGAGSLNLPDDESLIDKKIYYYYATGMINEAHHLAVESMVKSGLRPGNVKFIVKTEIIRGNYMVAARFISILQHTLHYRKWAIRYEKLISDTASIQKDPELGRRIALLPKIDFFIKPVDSLNIETVLRYNPSNHVAFEYRMARLLFEKDLKTIAREAVKMEEIGYNYMPAYIREAMTEAKFRNHEEMPEGITVPDDTESGFRQYLDDYNNNRGGSSFEEKMKAEWGNTFWYYYDFR